eukprot:CAMPEP_0167754418 /NCGR_PEP_ID=MMETSP0110_2-20121227/8256_1 /TAXON_ID=629695 /ORGANISM="Gymnochlora sp., Strain CCMP2014" /LENGTH=398 /DNA_ID=CAMNT_0007640289 /DNA_START=47 /DNA_END=1240 /DNA_ORIENTATION=+
MEAKAEAMAAARRTERKKMVVLSEKMVKGEVETSKASLVLRRHLPKSMCDALPGRLQYFFRTKTPLFEHLAYFSLRKCTEKVTVGMGELLASNTPRLMELDASLCQIETGFISAILRFCKRMQVLTIRDSIVYGEVLRVESQSLQLLTLASDTSFEGKDASNLASVGTVLHIVCPNLKQFYIDLSRRKKHPGSPIGRRSKKPQEPSSSEKLASTGSGLAEEKLKHLSISEENATNNSDINAAVVIPAFKFSTVESQILDMTKLTYLALTASRDLRDCKIFENLSGRCPSLRVLCIDGASCLQKLELKHKSLEEVSIVDCRIMSCLRLDCPKVTKMMITNCPIHTMEFFVPKLRHLDFMVPEKESHQRLLSRIVKSSHNLVELNGLPLDENHPEAAPLI